MISNEAREENATSFQFLKIIAMGMPLKQGRGETHEATRSLTLSLRITLVEGVFKTSTVSFFPNHPYSSHGGGPPHDTVLTSTDP